MKLKIAILFAFLSVFHVGCIKDALDRKPLNIVSDDDIWKSENLVVVYLASLYDNIPNGFSQGTEFLAHYTEEASFPYSGQGYWNDYGNQDLAKNIYMYTWIRKANYFLERIKTSELTEDKKASLSAECRFIRAYYYFDLVKKYGGMPIIETVQEFKDNLEELQVQRNTEDEVDKFILRELDQAIAGLPESYDGANSNRATKWAALALKSRAMLYAGTVAKYGSVQLNGLAGIPSENAQQYFTEAANAAQAIIDGGQFSLYTKLYDPNSGSGDASANYTSIFTDKGNVEVIFQKAYSAPDKVHFYDAANYPQSFKPGCCGNSIAPTYEFVEDYEYIDGSPGTLDIDNKEFDNPEDVFANKDPRLEGTIIRSGTIIAGRPVKIYRGVYDVGGTLYENFGAPFPPDPSISQVGIDGPYTLGDVGKTGLYIKKYLNMATITPQGQSDQNYIDFRLAEILLNHAEASFEANLDLTKALDDINLIRKRAGIVPITAPELTLDKIRHERKIELAFEDKRFWDLRRWRIGTTVFRNTAVSGLWPYLQQTGSGYKYVYKKKVGVPVDNGQLRTFAERDYYSNLSDYISSNKNIVNNPGW